VNPGLIGFRSRVCARLFHTFANVHGKGELKKKIFIFVQTNVMAERNDTGREGEEQARAYLMKKGYNVLHTNWRWHHYELDIVAIDVDMLVVAEVKTRALDHLISPEDSVDRKKMQRIVRAADAYVRYFNLDLPVRFDIITVIKGHEGYRIDHYDDAFLAFL